MTEKERQDLYTVFLRLLDGQLSGSRMHALNEQFSKHPDILEQFAEFIYLHEAVDCQVAPSLQCDETPDSTAVPENLFETCPTDTGDGRVAPTDLDLEEWGSSDKNDQISKIKAYANRQLASFLAEQQPTPPQTPPRNNAFNWGQFFGALGRHLQHTLHRLSRLTVAGAVLAGVVIMGMALVQYVLQHRTVATIEESVHAKWALPVDGNDLKPGWHTLQQGYARLVFKKGAQVIVQAPCEFRLCSDQKMICQWGSVSANVPEQALGFTVETPFSQIVDYGTEFGVLVGSDMESEIHVFNGEIGVGHVNSSPIHLRRFTEGKAVVIDRAGIMTQNPLEQRTQLFMREIPRHKTLGVPGQQLDLADIVGGGSGFGTGKMETMIDPFTGQPGPAYTPDEIWGTPQYRKAPSNPYIDGVFIPCGAEEQIVSTQGHVFSQCPEVSNAVFLGVINGPPPQDYTMTLNGTPYGSAAHPCLLIHANMGITFDLRALRDTMPGTRMTRFRAGIGVSEEPQDYLSSCDFWVLVDGDVRFHRHSEKYKGPLGVADVPLTPTDRFLSLVTTDAGDPFAERLDRTTPGDWGLFVEPVIELLPVAVGHP